MSTHTVETKQAIELQHAASNAYRLARDTRDADPVLARAPSVAGLQRAAAHAYADAARARAAATGI
ncbi:hypothetical protein BLA13014_01316 [Burkholderia aenigmatica]|uniref:Uncharacterized protein n=1 Tax=Burkholderia aenigmatica TaxID=2015348 RepID=A0A6P2IU92_9BURK|nr:MULTISPECIES: hypothetical protein [Burkholderia]MDN7515282.1 hypothetical protein [Burkholderia sp. AU45251]VWB33326.1 hypothetical protein BLA13014_01316 [Burkholderia aenigmatica]HDR9482083.1 hypothetical protein [Burkholderia aenigmatica]HDR9515550.1 hypothetical protein [Burkholderia aenigmatica]HDR9590454.1 hypothetical protein [Burkholderia aenigmatica]